MRLTAKGTGGECSIDGNICCPDDNCPQECRDQRIYRLQEYENACYLPDGTELISPAAIAELLTVRRNFEEYRNDLYDFINGNVSRCAICKDREREDCFMVSGPGYEGDICVVNSFVWRGVAKHD